MVTHHRFSNELLSKKSGFISPLKATVQTAFYGNNVREIESMEEVYHLVSAAPNAVLLHQKVAHAKELGLPEDARVILTNDGAVVGRTAKARRILGQKPEEDAKLLPIVREAVYQSSFFPFLKACAVVGLDEDFMVRAHITMPEHEVANLYSWLLNFQFLNDAYYKRLQESVPYDENDIYIFFDPTWSHPDYPDGLAYFDTKHNCAAILGMNYFGEIKKGTLTMAWGTAARNNYAACHGGLKEFKTKDKALVASFFGLSGSGKSTLTHAKHNGKYDVKVLHDDAFIISMENGSSVALEPSYFDKTNDYPVGHPEQEYFVTVQNCGVALNENLERVLVTEDIRNGNGRTVKSRYSTPNRVDKVEEPIDAIFWIMKDDALPPLIKIKDPVLATTFGCTLATKRSTAENTTESRDSLVIEPYANPFRVYPLVDDFTNFQKLFESGVDCYIVNTGAYLGKDVTKEATLALIEGVVDGTADFKPFGPLVGFEYADIEGYEVPDFDDAYLYLLRDRLQFRLDFLLQFNQDNPSQPLPVEAIKHVQELVNLLPKNEASEADSEG
ncbi:phosphoenolpyruvate carboxykinase (ATP) [Streptococcus moroccensis]|uniref:phosphoenolpyruvate carboxykinase (ATP) n=1 Tax=Streptococcus moroccensis TaxID=1451356 RepID=A0ABT9YU51_9STRE|nr:phosphoenolpyruvate carboxykinase (ATP) [Streptococcus moroccensis]MDQ0223249.1 phosphoenolpyruvate carboxykinase (ATP) [Streptococcus moroccensis]